MLHGKDWVITWWLIPFLYLALQKPSQNQVQLQESNYPGSCYSTKSWIFLGFFFPLFFPAWESRAQFLQMLMAMHPGFNACLLLPVKPDGLGIREKWIQRVWAQANSCKNPNEYSWHFCGIQPSTAFWTSPSSITASCREGEKLCSSHRSYQPFTAKLGPIQLNFPTLSTACKHPKHNPQSQHPPVILDVLYPCSLKTQGKHQPLQIISDALTPLLKTKQQVGDCLSHRDLESPWLRAESLSSARSSGCC